MTVGDVVTILGDVRLDRIASRIGRGETVEALTLRELLAWFGADRRGVRVNSIIREALDSRNLRVEPDLVATSLEGEIEFHKGSRAGAYSLHLLRHELASTRLAAWIDQNPNHTESEFRSKAADLDKLEIGTLTDYEGFVDDFMKIGANDQGLDGYEKLREIAVTLKNDGTTGPISVRELLRWFGTDRRGIHTTYMIRDALRMTNLRTEPDFNKQFIDNTIQFHEGYRESAIGRQTLTKMWVERVIDRLTDWIDRQPPDWHEKSPDARREAIQATAVAFSKLGLDDLAREPSNDEVNKTFHEQVNVNNTNYDDNDVESNVCDGEFVYHIIVPLPGSRWLPSQPADGTLRGPKNLLFINDATLRLKALKSANRAPASVSPNQRISEAIHIMLECSLPQLPVMVRREVKGVVTWRSIGCWLWKNGNRDDEVRHCMEEVGELPNETPLLEAVDDIVKRQYVLVRRQNDKTISGIVTATDLSIKLRELSEPFLILMEVENHIRGLISNGRFSSQDLREAKNPRDEVRTVEDASNLALGECLYLLSRPDAWAKLALRIDRKRFISQLEEVRRIRNKVMHFDRDPISDDDLAKLRRCVSFMQKVKLITDISR